MKRIIYILTVGALSASLMACGSDKAEEVQEQNGGVEVEKEAEKEMEKEEEDYEETEKASMGDRTVVKSKENLGLKQESGSFAVTVTDVEVATIVPSEEYRAQFEKGDKSTVVTIGLDIKYSSPERRIIFPNQKAKIAVNGTGEEKEPNFMLSNMVGGDFVDEVDISGDVVFEVDSAPESINRITYTIDPATDKDYNPTGEEPLVFEIEL